MKGQHYYLETISIELDKLRHLFGAFLMLQLSYDETDSVLKRKLEREIWAHLSEQDFVDGIPDEKED